MSKLIGKCINILTINIKRHCVTKMTRKCLSNVQYHKDDTLTEPIPHSKDFFFRQVNLIKIKFLLIIHPMTTYNIKL